MNEVYEEFGNIDIYLFDQLLKNRIHKEGKIIDVGCGNGRNLVYFFKNGYEVFGIDRNEESVINVKQLAKIFGREELIENFQIADADIIPFEDSTFDTVISSAVLHFSENEEHFRNMFSEMWRVLKIGGLFFARLASSIGIETKIENISGRRYLIPDGSERFLVDEEFLFEITKEVNGSFLEPIKTTNVQNLRCMTTWVLQKKVTTNKLQ